MDSIKQYFQDWSDACEYAKECAPDLAFLKGLSLGEPYTALAGIAALCFLAWAINERLIRSRRDAAVATTDDLRAALGRMAPQANRLAA